MSNMQSSLNNNNRRKGRERFKKQDSVDPKKTSYNLPEISDAERKSLVSKIVDRRKRLDRILIIAITIITLGAITLVIIKL